MIFYFCPIKFWRKITAENDYKIHTLHFYFKLSVVFRLWMSALRPDEFVTKVAQNISQDVFCHI
jgi:hypothetical protein